MSILKTRLAKVIVAAVVIGATTLGLSGTGANALARDPLPSGVGQSTSCTPGPIGTPGSIPALSFSKRSWPLTGGLHMNTSGAIDRNTGNVVAEVHLYNSYWAMGYTGGTMLVMKDRCGNPIWVTQPKQWGVDAKVWAWSMNERTEVYSVQVPDYIANRVASVAVTHSRVTSDTMINLYRGARSAACVYINVNFPLLGGWCPLPMFR